uniref:Uncharacterized protein n=1 Tax=Heterorhabditis bacteriophora TaxID=37862 RepID=A0A1I7WBE1_HETBA
MRSEWAKRLKLDDGEQARLNTVEEVLAMLIYSNSCICIFGMINNSKQVNMDSNIATFLYQGDIVLTEYTCKQHCVVATIHGNRTPKRRPSFEETGTQLLSVCFEKKLHRYKFYMQLTKLSNHPKFIMVILIRVFVDSGCYSYIGRRGFFQTNAYLIHRLIISNIYYLGNNLLHYKCKCKANYNSSRCSPYFFNVLIKCLESQPNNRVEFSMGNIQLNLCTLFNIL